MPPKRRQTRSTLSQIEKPHTSNSILEASHVVPEASCFAPHTSQLAPANDVPCPQIRTEVRLSNESLDAPPTLAVAGRRRQYWIVQLRKSDGEFKESTLRVSDVWMLPAREKVIIPFDGAQPSGTDALGLLGGFLGQLGSDHKIFPISFRSWHKIPTSYKNEAWNYHVKGKFWWDIKHESAARAYIMKDIGKKWRDNRLRLFERYYDSTKNREENINNPPLSIPGTEWASFIDYRLEPKTQEICDKNARNRRKLKINHTGGSKKIMTKAAEMSRTGQPVSRGLVYVETHKKHDGSYHNDETRAICEKINEIKSLGTVPISPSPNDSLGQVFGKEYPGWVRGVGSGVCPTQLFGSYQRYNGVSSSSGVESELQAQKEKIDDLTQKLKLETQRRMDLEERFNNFCKMLNLCGLLELVANSNNLPTKQAPVQPSTSMSGTHPS